jgi:hypothetical protein
VKDIPIIFELVIVGFEVLAWIFLLVLALFGYQWINLGLVSQWATQLSFALLGLAYMLGLIFDKAVSSLPSGSLKETSLNLASANDQTSAQRT